MIAGAEDATVSVNAFALVWLAPSVTCKVKLNEPAAVSVPLRMPALRRDKPPGNAPEASAHVYAKRRPGRKKSGTRPRPTRREGAAGLSR